jgi:hypothetical protein
MQGTLSELRNMAVSQDLVERLTMAYVKVARDAYVNAGSTAKQKTASVQLALNPRNLAERTRFLVVELAKDATDAELIKAAETAFQVYVATFPNEVVA